MKKKAKKKALLASAARALSAARKVKSGGRNGGRPRSCNCGRCPKCRHRKVVARWRAGKGEG